MSIVEKYINALKAVEGWCTVSEWAEKFGLMYPELLQEANKQAESYKNQSTGIREIAARISSYLSKGKWAGLIEIDESEKPRRVRFLTQEQVDEYIQKEIDEDVAPLNRSQKIKSDESMLSTRDKYRLIEFEAIITQLKYFFNLDFEFEHAKALLNPNDPGKHHPDNIQILLKSHNRLKSSSNWERFTLNEQIEYINAVVTVQKIVSSKMNIEIEENVIQSILERLKNVY